MAGINHDATNQEGITWLGYPPDATNQVSFYTTSKYTLLLSTIPCYKLSSSTSKSMRQSRNTDGRHNLYPPGATLKSIVVALSSQKTSDHKNLSLKEETVKETRKFSNV
jgi:hypothetical protein